MKNLFYYTAAVAALCTIASVAFADDFNIRHSRTRYNVWDWNTHPAIQQVPPPESAAERERMAKQDELWVARCKPVIKHDQYGMGRYVYAATGCEFGQYWKDGE